MQRCLAPHHGPVAVLTVPEYLSLHKTNGCERDPVCRAQAVERMDDVFQEGSEESKGRVARLLQEFETLNSEVHFPKVERHPYKAPHPRT